MTGPVFSQRVVVWLIVVGACAFVGMSYLLIYGDEFGHRSAGADSYSHSAIGHAAFAEFLRQSGISVQVSRYNSLAKAGSATLLIAAEPESGQALEALFAPGPDGAALPASGPILVVLPKWRGQVSEIDDRWLESVTPVPVAAAEAVLHVLDPEARLVRGGDAQDFDRNGVGIEPTLDAPQLMSAARMRPVIVNRQGYHLVSEIIRGDQVIWVLSDPDVIANHGIGVGDNAAFVLALVDALRPAGGTVVIDETIHGLTQQPNLWRALFEQPFVLVTIQFALTIALLLWAGVGRFGPPRTPARAIAPGAETLLDVGANLVKPERHGSHVLRHYAEAVIREVAARLHVPARATESERANWLDRIGHARGIDLSCRGLADAVDATTTTDGVPAGRLVAVARRIHQWKRDMLHGP